MNFKNSLLFTVCCVAFSVYAANKVNSKTVAEWLKALPYGHDHKKVCVVQPSSNQHADKQNDYAHDEDCKREKI